MATESVRRGPGLSSSRLANAFVILTFTAATFLVIFLWPIKSLALNLNFYKDAWAEFEIKEATGMSEEDLVAAGQKLIDYFEGRTTSPDLTVSISGLSRPLYNQTELVHLRDVRSLFDLGQSALNAAVFTVLTSIGLTAACRRKQFGPLLGRGFLYAGIGAILLLSLLMIPVHIDFTGWWNNFHLIAFTNDLWLLDPSNDWLIKMFPQEFFFSAVKKVGLRAFFLSGSSIALGLAVNYFTAHNRH